MLLHAYFTNGYFPWAKLFLESFKYYNGSDWKFLLTTKDLTDKEIKELHDIYPNLEVENSKINFKQLAKRAKTNQQQIKKFKGRTEAVKVDSENKVWKLMIAGDDRIKSIYDLMCRMEHNEKLLHFDIDTYFTGNIDPLVNLVERNDFTTKFRINKQIEKKGKVFRENRATLIFVMGFTINRLSKQFMETWIHYIDKVPPREREKGYGQTSCYYAYLDMIKHTDIRIGDASKLKLPWKLANKGGKTANLKKYWEHFEQIKENSNE